MSETARIDQIVKALQSVPPVKLKLIELANTLPRCYGQFTVEAIRDNRTEIRNAIQEATDYGGYTIRTVQALLSVMEECE
jgi:hypothetical protein